MGAKLKKRAHKKRALKKKRKEERFKKALLQQKAMQSRKEKLLGQMRAQFLRIDRLFTEYKKLFEEHNIEDFAKSFSEKVLQDPHWESGKEYRKGILSEYYVSLVLKKLQDENKIRSFFKTKRYGSLDLKSIDFELVLVNGKYFFFPLQVKSSVSYQKKHIKNKKNIASVVSTINLSLLKEKIETIIEAKKIRDEILHL